MMTIYCAPDGTVTICFPQGIIPCRQTIEKACVMMKKMREAAAWTN